VRRFHSDVLVVDDGSIDGTAQILEELAGRSDIHLIRHPVNRGYGQSLIDAFRHADRHGYDWVIHDGLRRAARAGDDPGVLSARSVRTGGDLISGSRYAQTE